jgi:hypothetical protein
VSTEPKLNPGRPSAARRHDHWLGGKDTFAPDRASGDLVEQHWRTVRSAANENLRFVHRGVAAMTAAGIDQFLDIGVGLPTSDNTHLVAQGLNPRARVVYVDNDPMVLSHARALLTATTKAGVVEVVDGDLRKPDSILSDPLLRGTFDLNRPVGLLLAAVLDLLSDDERPREVIAEVLEALPTGSQLALSHLSADLLPASFGKHFDKINTTGGIPMYPRSRDEITGLFAELSLVDPGLVPVHRWRPVPEDRSTDLADRDVGWYGALATKT